jgi:hypothetical protein
MPYKDPEKKREYDRMRRQTHKEQIAANKRRWSDENRDKIRTRSKQRRKDNPDYFKGYHANQDPVKRKARRMITNRVRDGKIPHCSMFTCADCNKKAEHYHHESYTEWWFIVALCHECHYRRHQSQFDI